MALPSGSLLIGILTDLCCQHRQTSPVVLDRNSLLGREELQCNWHTLNEESGRCVLLRRCLGLKDEISTSGRSIVSGQRNCPIRGNSCVFHSYSPGGCLGAPSPSASLIPPLSWTAESCAEICRRDEGCRWFNFHRWDKTCETLAECRVWNGNSHVGDGEDLVVSGVRECTPAKEHLWHRVAIFDGHASQTLDLSNATSSSCSNKSLSNPPFDTWGAVGAFVGGAALACVGKKCLVFNAFKNEWKDVGLKMIEERVAGAAAVLVQEDKWWITGGRSSSGSIHRSTELLDATSPQTAGFAPFTDLPDLEGREWHNLVRIDADRFFLLGGRPLNKKTWMFDYRWQIWQEKAPLHTARYAAATGVYTSKSDVFVVIAGGLGSIGGDNTNGAASAEIYSLAQNHWIKEERGEFFTFSYATTLDFGNSFVLMGGLIPDEGASDKIYRFEMTKKKDAKMTTDGILEESQGSVDEFEISFAEVGEMFGGRAGFLAMLVPTNFACN